MAVNSSNRNYDPFHRNKNKVLDVPVTAFLLHKLMTLVYSKIVVRGKRTKPVTGVKVGIYDSSS